MQRSLVAGLILAVLVVAGAGVAAFVVLRDSPRAGQPCTVTVDAHSWGLDREQVTNAQTISQTATNLGLPHHAVTVALAAAFQESTLHNLAHGDRDSVGLFQQRPSQGWGTPAQLLDTSYASEAFLRALSKVPGWDVMPVAEAAQSVQHSAAPGCLRELGTRGTLTGTCRNGRSIGRSEVSPRMIYTRRAEPRRPTLPTSAIFADRHSLSSAGGGHSKRTRG